MFIKEVGNAPFLAIPHLTIYKSFFNRQGRTVCVRQYRKHWFEDEKLLCSLSAFPFLWRFQYLLSVHCLTRLFYGWIHLRKVSVRVFMRLVSAIHLLLLFLCTRKTLLHVLIQFWHTNKLQAFHIENLAQIGAWRKIRCSDAGCSHWIPNIKNKMQSHPRCHLTLSANP